MLCDACGEKEATVHLTQMVNEDVKNLHLCEACAADSGLDVNSPMSLTDILLGLGGKQESDEKTQPDRICPVCQMHFSDFRKTSRLGCQSCYESFEEYLAPLIEGMQKGVQHVGKMPSKRSSTSDVPRSLLSLQGALRSAVAAENYEEAALIRDEICRHAQQERRNANESS